ncbi:MAG: sulfurtransferase-like selenium metabolism protein YedF [Nitrospirales bacterium]|nr:sulfurtransferase-like selenium metabolism protein YedF [Nitrospirales bacterium]
MIIDARGQGCPKPVMMAEEALAKIGEGMIEVLVDNEASVSNLSRFAAKNGFYAETFTETGYWRVKIAKGYACETVSGDVSPERQKDLLLIVASDSMGKEEALGKILMKGFFETMKVTGEIPHTIFFLNAGVRLTTVNEEIFLILKDLEEKGVEIFSCGTCLKQLNLESELKVGHRGTTNHVVEGMKDFQKTVWMG